MKGENNYKVDYIDYMQCDILKTDEPVDNDTVFRTFTEAKNSLLKILRNERDLINLEIKTFKHFKKKYLL